MTSTSAPASVAFSVLPRLGASLAALALIGALAPAALASPLPNLSERDVAAFRAAAKAGSEAAAAGDAVKAVRSFRRAVRIYDGNEGTWYNLACSEALRGQTALALDALEHARDAGWSDAEWPMQDSDLESLRDTTAFQEWIASVKEAAAQPETWPTPDPATVAATEEAIDEQGQERDQALRAVSGVLGAHASMQATRENAAWRAASWDRVAAAAADPEARQDAELSALKAVTGRDATRLSPVAAREAVARADAFLAASPQGETADTVRLLAAEARHALAMRENPEATDEDFERELLLLAATTEGDAAQSALAHLFGLYADDPARAGLVLARLETLAGPEEARTRLVSRDRGAFYALRGLPDFEATTLDGQTVNVAALKGQVTLIDFWATWCGPCRAELPNLKKTYAALHDSGFHVIGISLDSADDKSAEAFQDWCRENGVVWPQIYDGKGWQAALAERFGVRAIPFPLLVDAQGRVVATDEELRGDALLARVRAELAKGDGSAGLAGQ